MGNRFHNKYHRHSHHSIETSGDIDSANDPIASASDPFLGDFYLSGDLIVLSGDIQSDSATITSLQGVGISATNFEGSSLTIGTIDNSGSAITVSDNLDIGANSILNLTLDKLSNIVITAPVTGQILTYNAGNWENLDFTNIFATPIEFTTGTATTKAPTVAQVHTIDTEFIAITNHSTQAPTQSTTNSFTYTLSGFTGGVGLDTTEIRGVYIQTVVRAGPSNYYADISVTYPDGLPRSIAYARALDGNDEVNSNGVTYVPINKTQGSFTIVNSGTAEHQFTIFGCQQRSFG